MTARGGGGPARLTVVAAACATLVALMSIAPAHAAPNDLDVRRKEAQSFFEKGVKLAQAGDAKAALASFRAAYERYPSFRVLYNIGQLCSRMGEVACAVRSYEQYIRDGGADVPPKRREAVEAEIRSLSRALGTVVIRSNVSGHEVTIDDERVGRVPIAEPVPVSPGPHRIVLLHDKRKVEQTIKVASGESITVQLDVPREEPSPVLGPVGADKPNGRASDPEVEKPAPDRPEPATEGRRFLVVPWTITGALAAGTIVTGILAASAYGSYQDKRDEFPITRSELDDAQGSARTLFIVTSALGIATALSAGVASYFTFFAPSPSPSQPSQARVSLAAGPRGVAIVGVLP